MDLNYPLSVSSIHPVPPHLPHDRICNSSEALPDWLQDGQGFLPGGGKLGLGMFLSSFSRPVSYNKVSGIGCQVARLDLRRHHGEGFEHDLRKIRKSGISVSDSCRRRPASHRLRTSKPRRRPLSREDCRAARSAVRMALP